MQYACAILSVVACPALPLFRMLSHKGHDFRKKVNEPENAFWFCPKVLSEIFVILRRMTRDIVISAVVSSCKLSVILLRFLCNFEFSRQIFAKCAYIKFNKNSPIWNPLVPCGRTDMQTHMTMLIVVFPNFANTLKATHSVLCRELIGV